MRKTTTRTLPCAGLWGLMNNAGAMVAVGLPEWTTVADYRRQCDVNLFGLIDVTLTFLPLVRKSRGRIVNTTSLIGRLALSTFAAYSVSKFGVEAFSDTLRYGGLSTCWFQRKNYTRTCTTDAYLHCKGAFIFIHTT